MSTFSLNLMYEQILMDELDRTNTLTCFSFNSPLLSSLVVTSTDASTIELLTGKAPL